jgi:hypothetical protein
MEYKGRAMCTELQKNVLILNVLNKLFTKNKKLQLC